MHDQDGEVVGLRRARGIDADGLEDGVHDGLGVLIADPPLLR